MKRIIPLPSSCFSKQFLAISNEIFYRSNTLHLIEKSISEITHKDVPFPVMKGIDNIGRLFIVIKLVVDNQITLQIILQLHGRCYPIWKAIGTDNPLIYHKSILHFDQLKLILGLIRNQTLVIKDESIVTAFYLNKPLSLQYTSRCIDAANTIRNKWLLCRYNPEYVMCATVQMRNMETVYLHHNKIVNF